MSAEKLYTEVIAEFEQATTRQERINVLRKYDHPRFRTFLQVLFKPEVEFDVMIPTYRPAPEPAGLNYTYLDAEMLKIYRFIKNHPNRPQGLTAEKQSQLLLVILESLHKDEAELLTKVIRKKLEVKFLTPNLINDAFPNLI